MKILFFGDSITDANRNREGDFSLGNYGLGFVRSVAGTLMREAPDKYRIFNRGIAGNRVVDLYARIKIDCWNLEPDVLNILIGVNDVWHEIATRNGVEIDRFENVYRMMLKETKQRLPNTKLILCEPFLLKGKVTEASYEEFLAVKEYAKVVKKLAEEYECYFIPLQEKIDAFAEQYGVEACLTDGVHPAVGGAQLIADEWLKLFKEQIYK